MIFFSNCDNNWYTDDDNYYTLVSVHKTMGCISFYRVDRVVQLLDAGLDVNSWDSQGSKNTPLHWAACYGNKDIIACLLGNV